jgi:hypothetical protein
MNFLHRSISTVNDDNLLLPEPLLLPDVDILSSFELTENDVLVFKVLKYFSSQIFMWPWIQGLNEL